MAIEDFLPIRIAVLTDPVLQEPLRAAPDEASLFQAVMALGRERGHQFSEQDLRAIVNANRLGWLQRWLYQ
jgi:hypothetical protein